MPGSRLILDDLGKPVFVKGVPLWHLGKIATTEIHFKNAAAKRRVKAKAAAMGVGYRHVRELLPLAEPRDLVRVPTFRGFPARFANEVRAKIKAGRPFLWPRKKALAAAA